LSQSLEYELNIVASHSSTSFSIFST